MSTRMLLSDCVIIDTQRWFKSPINPPEILFILTKVFLCLRGPIPQRQQKHCGCESNSVSSLLLADLHALSLKIWQRSQTHFTPKFSPTATRFTEDTKRENLQELYLFCHWSTRDVLYSLAPHPPPKKISMSQSTCRCVCVCSGTDYVHCSAGTKGQQSILSRTLDLSEPTHSLFLLSGFI